jgi:cell division protein FtsQ
MSKNKTLSRSEIIRKRRLEKLRKHQEQQATQQRQTRISRPKKKKSRGKSGRRELPPITARGVVNDFAIERRKKTKKRRFNAAISLPRLRGLPGPKIRALSLPRIHIRIGWRLLSFFLVALLGTGLYLFWTLPEFRVGATQVTGNQRITADEINSVLELNEYPVFLLTPEDIKNRVLLNYPELASVDVTIALPNLVTVNVTERQPIILWQQDGGFTWVDETGTAFRPRGEAGDLILVQALDAPPVMSAPEDDPLTPVQFIPDETVKAITALAPYVPPDTPILYHPVTGLSWTDGRGWQVVFGTSGDDTEIKVRVYQVMVDWLAQRGIRPILINVAYPNAPFYRVEQAEVEVEAEEQ